MRAFGQKLVLIVSDVFVLNAGVLLAFLIRFEGNPPSELLSDYERVAVLYTALTLVAFWLVGLYSSLWRYASVDEVFTVLKGTTLSVGIFAVLVYALPHLAKIMGWAALLVARGFPRSVIILTWLLNSILVGALRFSIRVSRRTAQVWRVRLLSTRKHSDDADNERLRRVLVVGAGDAGSLAVQELSKHADLRYEPVGFIDDDLRKQGMRVHGLLVLGTRQTLSSVVTRTGADEILIAMPSVPGRVIREIVQSCKDLPVKIRILPGVYELLNGTVSINQIREVQIEDLLGREPVEIDLKEVAGYLRAERVIVTGAGGSIGSELCRQVARFRPRELLLLDNSENGAFETSLDLQQRFPDVRQRVIMADVREREKMLRVFAQNYPDVVFHAAAHKHVPLMEEHPDEAVRTNILGTKNVAEAARRYGTKKFVLISTDKAVNPSSVMGATKRVAEMIIQALDAERQQHDSTGTRFVAVRFGNVLGSRGSVVPIFKEQIARGGPVTVTHPEMRRYFMTIPEAVQLVIQAGAMGEGGEIFVLDMGEPVRILDLAENLIRLSGFEPGTEVPIVITGPRPGEKLFEELLTAEEGALATRHRRIHVSRIRHVDPAWLERHLLGLAEMVQNGYESSRIVSRLREVVPNFHSSWWAELAVGGQAASGATAPSATC